MKNTMYKVVMSKDGVKKDLALNMTEEEAYEMCEAYDWEFYPSTVFQGQDWWVEDESDVWDLSVEEM